MPSKTFETTDNDPPTQACRTTAPLFRAGMFQLIGEEASRHDLLVRPQLAAALAAALVLGVAGMAVIALWG